MVAADALIWATVRLVDAVDVPHDGFAVAVALIGAQEKVLLAAGYWRIAKVASRR